MQRRWQPAPCVPSAAEARTRARLVTSYAGPRARQPAPDTRKAALANARKIHACGGSAPPPGCTIRVRRAARRVRRGARSPLHGAQPGRAAAGATRHGAPTRACVRRGGQRRARLQHAFVRMAQRVPLAPSSRARVLRCCVHGTRAGVRTPQPRARTHPAPGCNAAAVNRQFCASVAATHARLRPRASRTQPRTARLPLLPRRPGTQLRVKARQAGGRESAASMGTCARR
jgi:hypothetical protein